MRKRPVSRQLLPRSSAANKSCSAPHETELSDLVDLPLPLPFGFVAIVGPFSFGSLEILAARDYKRQAAKEGKHIVLIMWLRIGRY